MGKRSTGGVLTGAAALALVSHDTEAALLADLDAALTEGCGFAVATLNLDHLVKMARDAGFAARQLAVGCR